MSDPFDALPAEARRKLREQEQPRWVDPMLATLTDERFSDPDWIYERKLDGVRILAFRNGDDVRLMTRNEKRRNAAYPEVVDALAAEPGGDFIVDGEVVAFAGNVTSFSRLQERMKIDDEETARASDVAVYYYIFDLLHLDGHDVSRVSLRHRKALLKRALDFHGPVRYTQHRNEDGEAFWKEACGQGWEGVIAKDATSTYVHSRSRSWLKFKCVNRQEFVIAGFTDPQGERSGFGALLIGYYEGGTLRYAGKVGTGYDEATLTELRRRMDALERETPAFDEESLPTTGVHWITPKLVAEVGFTEWTGDGKLRHPRYEGLRDDKAAEDVVREQPR